MDSAYNRMEHSRFWYACELESRYGAVKRARGQYLYTQSGARLVDMYQEGGRAVLGWGAGKALTHCKNTANRGALGTFITAEQHRLHRAVHNLLPLYTQVRWYGGAAAAAAARAAVSAELWRPWGEDARSECVWFAPPFPWGGDTVIICCKDAAHDARLPESDLLAPPVLAGMTRALYDLAAELPRRDESLWRRHDKILLKYWKRRGPYLYPLVSEKNYTNFFLHCLDCGLYISPQYKTASIVPHEASDGDFTRLKRRPYDAE